MGIATADSLVATLCELGLVDPGQGDELRQLAGGRSDARDLARHLIQREVVTAFQVNQILQGKGKQLLLGPYLLLERLDSPGQLLDAALQKHKLDALVVGTGGLPPLIDPIAGDAWPSGPNSPTLPAVAGYPHVTVPAGWYHGLPLGLSFICGPYSEGKLLGYAFAFEQATHHRKTPRYLPTAPV